ncbi:MAG: DUF4230 domain-containing protein [Lachnospiraceae bacterium]|nr:DUF4230 domain-containing protein [Lachnospiraceae bacterium]
MKKKIMAGLLCTMALLSLSACKKEEQKTVNQTHIKTSSAVTLDNVKNICELATMKCYYHNVAESTNEKKILFVDLSSNLWIEYDGEVVIGVDAKDIEMGVSGNIVTINMPEAKILSYKVDEKSLTKSSYYSDSSKFLSNDVDAADQTKAFEAAQKKMLDKAKTNKELFTKSRERAMELIENYVLGVGELVGKNYEIVWVDKDAPATSKPSK